MFQVFQAGGRAFLSHLAFINHHNARGEAFDQTRIMRNEEIGDAFAFLQFRQERQRRCLKVDVEVGNGFIENDEFRLRSQSAGDADALQLSATNL